jgi:hypothetical protein
MLGHIRFVQRNFAAEVGAVSVSARMSRGKATPPGLVRLDTTRIKRWRQGQLAKETERIKKSALKG